MRSRTMIGVAAAVWVAACAGGPGPGGTGNPYNVEGFYAGRLTVEGEPFDATLELRMSRGGTVRGTFTVSSPVAIDGRVEGTLIDDLLRIVITYEGAASRASGATCDNRVEGILSVSRGGGMVEGPVTITDCGDALAGRMSFRRRDDPS